MRLRGHKYAFKPEPEDEKQDGEEEDQMQAELQSLDDDPDSIFLARPTLLTRKAAIDWVKRTLERSRGYELPGTFQPLLISQLFWEQSQPWEKIAYHHISTVASACK